MTITRKRALDWLKENWIIVAAVLFVAGIIAAIAVFFSNYESLTEGTVIDKYYEPAREIYSPIHITIDGKDQTISNYRYVGDRWRLIIQNGEKKDMWFVTESFYDSVKIGDWVTK